MSAASADQQPAPWRIDRGLATDLAEALGWSAEDGPAALARRIPERLPCGSTAKLAAIAAGGVPPGADVDALAATVLGHLHDPGGRSTGGSPSWSCWVLVGLVAAVLDGAGIPAEVVITRRIDAEAPAVDLHGTVLAGPPGERWFLQPYFGLAAPHPTDGPASVDGDLPIGTLRAWVGDDGRVEVEEHLRRWPAALRYRVLAIGADRDDVAAMAAISATHTGVPFRPYARLHRPDGTIVDAREADDGRFLVGTWTPGGVEPNETTHPTWPGATEHFLHLTGISLR